MRNEQDKEHEDQRLAATRGKQGAKPVEKKVQYGLLVRERREALGMTQDSLAIEAKLSTQRHVRMIEKGAHWPTPRTRQKINAVLAISVFDMLRVEGKEPDTYELDEGSWLEYRRLRRGKLHPVDEETGDTQRLVNTSSCDAALTVIFDPDKRHILLSGDIASGKSSTVELLVQAWQDRYPKSGRVTLLPLAGEFSSGAQWDRSAAHLSFMDKVEARAGQPRINHLFVVEDMHEHFFAGRAKFSFEKIKNVDLANCAVIVTTRSGMAEQIMPMLLSWKNSRFERIETSADEIADKLISQNFHEPREIQAFHSLYDYVGNSLIALSAALAFALSEGKTMINIELAYQSVAAELSRVFDASGENTTYESNETDKLSLLVVWMLGGMEVEFLPAELAAILDEIDADTTIPKVQSFQEIFVQSNGRIRCKRHPAWGQLVMAALQDSKSADFRNIRQKLRTRLLSGLTSANAPIDESEKAISNDILTLFLYTLLYQEVASTEWLGFMATGRHMHEEFALAGRHFIDGEFSINGKIENRSDLLLEIATSVRRSTTDDHEQRQELLKQCQLMIDEVTEIELERTGATRIEELGGRLLYEIGYLEMLSGDIEAANQKFHQSKLSDYAVPGRSQFGVMSAVVECITQVYLGNLMQAALIIDETDAVFEALSSDQSVDPVRLKRFIGNAMHAKFEVALAKKIASDARAFVQSYAAICAEVGQRYDTGVYLARIAILESDFSEAETLARGAIAQGVTTSSAEGYNSTYRTLGDALLGLGRIDEAKDAYSRVVSEDEDLQGFLDQEMATVVKRRIQIEQGLTMPQIANVSFV